LKALHLKAMLLGGDALCTGQKIDSELAKQYRKRVS
jgi:hypothetical protein